MSKLWAKYSNKMRWYLILVFAAALFIISLFTLNPVSLVFSLILGLLVKYKGYDILFGNYDKRIRDVQEKYKKINDFAREREQ